MSYKARFKSSLLFGDWSENWIHKLPRTNKNKINWMRSSAPSERSKSNKKGRKKKWWLLYITLFMAWLLVRNNSRSSLDRETPSKFQWKKLFEVEPIYKMHMRNPVRREYSFTWHFIDKKPVDGEMSNNIHMHSFASYDVIVTKSSLKQSDHLYRVFSESYASYSVSMQFDNFLWFCGADKKCCDLFVN